MSVFEVDLTTRFGARGATGTASAACLLFGCVYGYLAMRVLRAFDLATIPYWFLAAVASVFIVSMIAAWRFRIGQGVYAGVAMILMMIVLLGISVQFAIWLADAFSIFFAIPLSAVCLVIGRFVFNGIRAAWVLKGVPSFEDDDIAVFQ
ncbi:hypothetical protein [Novosphingobium cyanobacteriorum]|uniref:Uncharacterized protein n=1 Tax=Novosphingobium cyanobacteriorum TaxID=3024215 RepID=A0ABT6CI98_9SPHN|nr:hypothetical protein [Novosphingobium cyanobacteriorum]MDF8333511.1 hypothetical protein [Novosphingobium cyanobacteriorum]